MTTTTDSFDLQRIQKIRKIFLGLSLLGILIVSLFTATWWGHEGVHQGVEAAGLGAMVLSIVGRAWCSLYIGGRKKAEVVSTGPYSISRNPLYVFSYVGAFGIGAQTGSMVIAALFVVVAVLVFHATIAREEAWLSAAFSDAYDSYRAQIPRCGPDFSKWRDEDELKIRPRFFLTTLRDGMVFFLAIPVFEAMEWAQAAGWVPVLLRLP